MLRTRFFVAAAVAVFVPALAAFAEDQDTFPCPDIIKNNVEFWKKIYTEIPLGEGLLHDYDYPLVIYDRVKTSDRGGGARAFFVKTRKEHIESLVRAVTTQPESTWTDEQKAVAGLLKQYVPPDQWAGAPDRVRFQLGQMDRFREGLERSGAFIDTIRAIFASYGIPRRVAFLPHVESSFNTNAYSKVGAAGLWQFMRGTGKNYLTINYLIDERRDVYMATVAAAKLLKGNYDQLGAWPLAITAYNHGLNGMLRAVNMTGSRDIGVIIEEYQSPAFQFASKNFYACFLAASQIAANPGLYFKDLHFQAPRPVREIQLSSYVRPDVICKQLGVAFEALEELNPALRPVVFQQRKKIPAGFRLRVPAQLSQQQVAAALAAIPDSLKSNEPDRAQYYRVKRGDNLAGIASRLGVSAGDIARDNDLTASRRIYAGQVLRIPAAQVASAEVKPDTGVAKVALAAPLEQPEQAEETPAAPAPAPGESAGVKATAAAVAARPARVDTVPPVAVSVTPAPAVKPAAPKPPPAPAAAAAAAAKPKPAEPQPKAVPDSLRELLMAAAIVTPEEAPGGAAVLPPRFDVEVYNLETSLSPTGDAAEIRVSVNETVGHYADWLGVPGQRIRGLNHLNRSSSIHINDKLLIPIAGDALDRFVSARLEYHMAIEEDFYTQYKVTDVKTAYLKKGQALWEICNGDEEIPLWLFKKYNKQLDLSKLMPGTAIFLPVIEEKTALDIEREAHPDRGIYHDHEQPKRAVGRPVSRTP